VRVVLVNNISTEVEAGKAGSGGLLVLGFESDGRTSWELCYTAHKADAGRDPHLVAVRKTIRIRFAKSEP